jgi:hypothetical protein
MAALVCFHQLHGIVDRQRLRQALRALRGAHAVDRIGGKRRLVRQPFIEAAPA